MHLRLTNGTPAKYTLGQLRRDNANTSFPKLIPDDLLASYDVYPYTRPTQPTLDGLTQDLVDGAFEQDVDGNWSHLWVVEDKPLEEAERNTRSHRDGLLKDTDWMAVTDRTMTGPEIAYRKSLRDVPQQAGFPKTHTWPNKP